MYDSRIEYAYNTGKSIYWQGCLHTPITSCIM